MLTIKKRYLVDDRNEPIAVQIDLATWTKIEEALEDHFIGKSMQDSEREDALDRATAVRYYQRLKKV